MVEHRPVAQPERGLLRRVMDVALLSNPVTAVPTLAIKLASDHPKTAIIAASTVAAGPIGGVVAAAATHPQETSAAAHFVKDQAKGIVRDIARAVEHGATAVEAYGVADMARGVERATGVSWAPSTQRKFPTPKP